MNEVFAELKRELETHNIDLPKDSKGLINKEVFVNMQMIIYKYKMYGREILSEANFRERIVYLEEQEEMKRDGEDKTPEGMARYKELQTLYDNCLKGESEDMAKFDLKVQDYVFDYFNLIIKEFYLN